MKILHPKFGQIEVTPQELVELDALVAGESREQSFDAPRRTRRVDGRKNSVAWEEEEIKYLVENVAAGPTSLSNNKFLKQRHTKRSIYSMAWLVQQRKLDQLSKMARNLILEHDKNGNQDPKQLLTKDYNNYTEA